MPGNAAIIGAGQSEHVRRPAPDQKVRTFIRDAAAALKDAGPMRAKSRVW